MAAAMLTTAPGSFERDELECAATDLDAAADTLEQENFFFSSPVLDK